MLESLIGATPKTPDSFSDVRNSKSAARKDAPGERFFEVMERIAQKNGSSPKDTEDIRKDFAALKESLRALEQEEGFDKEDFAPIKEIMEQLEKMLAEDVELPPLLQELASLLVNFAAQAKTEYQESGALSDNVFYLGEKMAFALEGIIQDIQGGTLSLDQKQQVKELILQTKAGTAESRMFLARIGESLVEDAQSAQTELAKDPKSFGFTVELPSKEGSERKTPLIGYEDARTPLKNMLKEQALEVKLSLGGAEARPETPILAAEAPILRSLTDISKAEAVFAPSHMRQIEAMMSQIGARAFVVLRDGSSEFRMKLSPPELGQMKISFRLEEGVMQGKIVVSTPEAKALFEENMNMLKESFRQAGVNIAHVDVSLGGQGSFEDARDIIENHIQYKAVRIAAPVELMSRGLSMSEIDYTA